ncbi:MAG: hypothetical protein AAF756_09510 [Pseudomonadota bacterium]
MINCTCIVQEGQAPDLRQSGLQELINRFTEAAFGEAAQITWIPVAPGNGFTERKPSTSSVVSMRASESLKPDRRESLLRELVELWTSATGCSVSEVVAVISDPEPQ